MVSAWRFGFQTKNASDQADVVVDACNLLSWCSQTVCSFDSNTEWHFRIVFVLNAYNNVFNWFYWHNGTSISCANSIKCTMETKLSVFSSLWRALLAGDLFYISHDHLPLVPFHSDEKSKICHFLKKEINIRCAVQLQLHMSFRILKSEFFSLIHWMTNFILKKRRSSLQHTWIAHRSERKSSTDRDTFRCNDCSANSQSKTKQIQNNNKKKEGKKRNCSEKYVLPFFTSVLSKGTSLLFFTLFHT